MMKKKIMLVDDEAPITRMMRRNLEATGRFDVLDVNNPMLALETARRFEPDLVFLDVMMPGKDGGDVAADFADDPQLSKIPIVFLTAIVSKKEVEPAGSTIGQHTFLAKPVRLEDLLTCINDHIG